MTSKIEELKEEMGEDGDFWSVPFSKITPYIDKAYALGREEGQFETEKSCQRDYVQLLEEAEREAKQQGIKIGIEKAVGEANELKYKRPAMMRDEALMQGGYNQALHDLISSLTSDELLKK